MKIIDSENDQYGTYLSGLAYSIALMSLILLFIYLLVEQWFDSLVPFLVVGLSGILFFITGFKKVDEKNLGFLSKFGRRNFDEYYGEGWWWIFPLWRFNQKPNFNVLNKSDKLSYTFITSDEIPLQINLTYYWYIKDPKDADNKPYASFIEDILTHEIGNYVRSSSAADLLTDLNISNSVLIKYLKEAGNSLGLSISNVFPNINLEPQYLPVLRSYQEKYKELKFALNKTLLEQSLKQSEMNIYAGQIINLIKNFQFSNSEALSFIKIYKNQVNMSDTSLAINDLNKILETVIAILKK